MRVALTILLALAGVVLLGGRSASATSQPCSLRLVAGQAKCFAPARAGAALRLVSHAVNPSQAVYQATHLTLHQVIVISAPTTISRGKGKVPKLGPMLGRSIQFRYGTLKGNTLAPGSTPKYMVINEVVARIPRFVGRYYQNGLEISPAILRRNQPAYGPWYVRANFPHDTLSLSIAANFDQATLKQLAHRILQAGG